MSLLINANANANKIREEILPTFKNFLTRELSSAIYFSDEEVETINTFVKEFLNIKNFKFSNEIDVNLFHVIFEMMEKI